MSRHEPTLRDLLRRHVRGRTVSRQEIEDVKRRARCYRDAVAMMRAIRGKGDPNV